MKEDVVDALGEIESDSEAGTFEEIGEEEDLEKSEFEAQTSLCLDSNKHGATEPYAIVLGRGLYSSESPFLSFFLYSTKQFT